MLLKARSRDRSTSDTWEPAECSGSGSESASKSGNAQVTCVPMKVLDGGIGLSRKSLQFNSGNQKEDTIPDAKEVESYGSKYVDLLPDRLLPHLNKKKSHQLK